MSAYSLQRPRAASPWGGSFDQLRREMDTLLSRFGGGPGLGGNGQGVFPAVNLYETQDAYVLMAELPGVSPDDIHVSLEGPVVTLEGSRAADVSAEELKSVHRRERQMGRFRRSFQLPATVEADKVEAVHKNGVLLLRLPKTADQQPRRITIQS